MFPALCGVLCGGAAGGPTLPTDCIPVPQSGPSLSASSPRHRTGRHGREVFKTQKGAGRAFCLAGKRCGLWMRRRRERDRRPDGVLACSWTEWYFNVTECEAYAYGMEKWHDGKLLQTGDSGAFVPFFRGRGPSENKAAASLHFLKFSVAIFLASF